MLPTFSVNDVLGCNGIFKSRPLVSTDLKPQNNLNMITDWSRHRTCYDEKDLSIQRRK